MIHRLLREAAKKGYFFSGMTTKKKQLKKYIYFFSASLTCTLVFNDQANISESTTKKAMATNFDGILDLDHQLWSTVYQSLIVKTTLCW